MKPRLIQNVSMPSIDKTPSLEIDVVVVVVVRVFINTAPLT